jgi:hypothetical protein
VHPRGESKKFNIARGESKEKKIQVGKTKLAHITGGNNLFTLNLNIGFIFNISYDIFYVQDVKKISKLCPLF